jgi:ketosteroid isomerase-like protein
MEHLKRHVTYPATERKFRVQVCDVHRIKNGKITETRA